MGNIGWQEKRNISIVSESVITKMKCVQKTPERENVCAQGNTNKVKEGVKEVYPSLIYLICAGKSPRQMLEYHLNAFGY